MASADGWAHISSITTHSSIAAHCYIHGHYTIIRLRERIESLYQPKINGTMTASTDDYSTLSLDNNG
jgi:hypothetical protein